MSVDKQQRGSAFIEVAAGLILFLAILFIFLDVWSILFGVILNDTLARDSARAAAMGPPGRLIESKKRVVEQDESPYRRAFAVIESREANLPKQYELVPSVEITETLDPPVPVKPFGGRVCGTVSIRITMLIHPGFILDWFKIGPISCTSQKSCPYTWIMKY